MRNNKGKTAVKIIFCDFAYNYCKHNGPSSSFQLKDAFINANPYKVWRNIGTNNSISNWLNSDSRFYKAGSDTIWNGTVTSKYVAWGIV